MLALQHPLMIPYHPHDSSNTQHIPDPSYVHLSQYPSTASRENPNQRKEQDTYVLKTVPVDYTVIFKEAE